MHAYELQTKFAESPPSDHIAISRVKSFFKVKVFEHIKNWFVKPTLGHKMH